MLCCTAGATSAAELPRRISQRPELPKRGLGRFAFYYRDSMDNISHGGSITFPPTRTQGDLRQAAVRVRNWPSDPSASGSTGLWGRRTSDEVGIVEVRHGTGVTLSRPPVLDGKNRPLLEPTS